MAPLTKDGKHTTSQAKPGEAVADPEKDGRMTSTQVMALTHVRSELRQ